MVDEENEKNIDTSNMSVEEMNEIQKQNCVFCKIKDKQIPAKVLHEDDKIICILDINPASEGHILVYPKEHYMILPHIPEDILRHLFRTVKLMSNTLLKTLQCKGTSIFIANGMAAGQKAPHVLIHVFPRRENDGLLELPKYEMTNDQSEKLKAMMTPYLNQIFGKKAMPAARSMAMMQHPKEKHGTFDTDKDASVHMAKKAKEHDEEQEEIEEENKEEQEEIEEENKEEQEEIEEVSQEPGRKNAKTSDKDKSEKKHAVHAKKKKHDTEKELSDEDTKPRRGVDLDDIARLFGG